MGKLRHLVFVNRTLAGLILAAALLIKAVVPSGYMIGNGSATTVIAVCSDATGGHMVRQITIPLRNEAPAPAQKGKQDCAYSTLVAAALAGAAPALLAAALLFIVLSGFWPGAKPRRQGTRHLRPPLRGPPLAA